MLWLLRNIQRELDAIEDELQHENKTLEFYDEFFKKNKCATFDGILDEKLNLLDLAVALIAVDNPDIDIEKIRKTVYGNSSIFQDIDLNIINGIYNIAGNIESENIFEIVKSYVLKEKGIDFFKKLTKEARIATLILKLTDNPFTSYTGEGMMNLIELCIKKITHYQRQLLSFMQLRT